MSQKINSFFKVFVAASLLGTVLASLALPVVTAASPCSDAQVYISIPLDSSGNHCINKNEGSGVITSNPIYVWMLAIMKFLAAGVGISVTAGIVYGGILYSSSQGNPAQTKKAISVIVSAVTGLILFIMMSAIVNFIIPGGIFQ
ncbi:MAG TPA: hypothetical protein VNG90_01820 [Candidatus Acidoferrum sp.]|nr:hypothetical protein [Candidatus Acidoferrum sp.]